MRDLFEDQLRHEARSRSVQLFWAAVVIAGGVMTLVGFIALLLT
jgi:hypothetical protein